MKKIKAVIYARYSSHKQTENSIEGQVKYCEEYANINNIEIVGSYFDREKSGTDESRPEFQRMISDSSKKNFQMVLVYQYDRFARDVTISRLYKNKLKTNGVSVVSVMEGCDSSSSGIFLQEVIEAFGEYYINNLRELVNRGMAYNAEHCYANGGKRLFGYKTKDKKYIIFEEEATIVREIFQKYKDGYKPNDIAISLNERNIVTTENKVWNARHISALLDNRKYIGEYHFGNYVKENGMPGIIDKDLFFRCQQKKAIAPYMSKDSKNIFFLHNKVKCSCCGEYMINHTSNAHGKSYTYYKCKNKSKNKECSESIIHKTDLEEMVLTNLQAMLDEATLRSKANVLYETNKDNLKTNIVKEKLDEQLQIVNDQIDKCLDDLLDGDYNEIMDKIDELKLKALDIKEKIKKGENNSEDDKKEEIYNYLKYIRDFKLDDDYSKALYVDFFVDEIMFYNNKKIAILLK